MGRASSRDGMRHNTPCRLSLPALIPCCVARVGKMEMMFIPI